MFAVYIIALFCLVSVSQSAPLACEDFIQPLDQLDPHHLEGRWVLVAGSLSDPALLENFKRRDSASIKFGNANKTSNIVFTRIFNFNGSCQYLHLNISLEGNSITFNQFNLTVTFLYTSCPDCVVMRFDTDSHKLLRCYLFSRRREVEQKEMEEFRAQVECLNMPPPVVMDPTKELCPEETASEPAAQTEEKTKAQKP